MYSTANAGDPIRWKGTDVHFIKKGTYLIEKAVTSQDWFWLLYCSGAKVGFQKNKDGQCLSLGPPPGAR